MERKNWKINSLKIRIDRKKLLLKVYKVYWKIDWFKLDWLRGEVKSKLVEIFPRFWWVRKCILTRIVKDWYRYWHFSSQSFFLYFNEELNLHWTNFYLKMFFKVSMIKSLIN